MIVVILARSLRAVSSASVRIAVVPLSQRTLDPLAEQVMYPTVERLLAHCDAVLRLPGKSTGADQDVAIARQRGIPVYERIEEIPGYTDPAA
jgi:hypothetical protein